VTREVNQEMDDHEAGDLRLAFEAILGSSAEPPLPSLTDTAVAAGRRRIRRRRAALSAAGVLVTATLALTAGLGLPTTGPDHPQLPQAPVTTTPHPTRTLAPAPTVSTAVPLPTASIASPEHVPTSTS
jgi:hypothetical protein